LDRDLYELPGKQPLPATVSLSYLPSLSSLLTKSMRPTGAAVVVADPDGTLPRARDAGEQLARMLETKDLLIGEQATRQQLTSLLSGRSVLHFIGHASIVEGDPWTTKLELANSTRLGAADMLSIRPQLGLAVLEGCTTGARTPSGEFGLPQVMIAGGTHTVLATVRELGAGEATKFMKRFYGAGGAERPAQAFKRAIQASIAANDPSWRAFRLWGRR
jgi:CHAT domain-containing protein